MTEEQKTNRRRIRVDDLLRFRCEPEFRRRLETLAANNHETLSAFVRRALWNAIKEEEKRQRQDVRLQPPRERSETTSQEPIGYTTDLPVGLL